MNTFKLSQFQIKYIVICLMTLGHIGYFLFSQTIWGKAFDIISQVTGLTMAYFLFEGFYHTRSLAKYILRLSICGVVTQVFLHLLGVNKLNICFSFIICLLILNTISMTSTNRILKIVTIICLFALSWFCEGELMYPIFVSLLYLYKKDRIKLLTAYLSASLFSFGYNFSAVVYYSLIRRTVYYDYGINCILVFLVHVFGGYGLIAFLYDGTRGHDGKNSLIRKYFFYIYYPIQFAAIFAIIRMTH